jgi:hypothetical protein
MMLRCAARAGGHVASSSRADRRPPAINPSASGVRMPTSPGCWAGLRWQAPDLDGLEMPSLRGGVEGLTARPRHRRRCATGCCGLSILRSVLVSWLWFCGRWV